MDDSSQTVLGFLVSNHVKLKSRRGMPSAFLMIFLGSCAVLSSPVETIYEAPEISMDIPHALPEGIRVRIRARGLRNAESIQIYRAIEGEDFRAWKTLIATDFKRALRAGVLIKDPDVGVNQEVRYIAQTQVEKIDVSSSELVFKRISAPPVPLELRAKTKLGHTMLSWEKPRVEQGVGYTLVYRRNMLKNSPIEGVSSLIKQDHWVDTETSVGVYSYQIGFVNKIITDAGTTLYFGILSEPIYVTLEAEDTVEKLD